MKHKQDPYDTLQLQNKRINEENREAEDELNALYQERDDYLRLLENFVKGRQGELLSEFEHRVIKQTKKRLAKYKKV